MGGWPTGDRGVKAEPLRRLVLNQVPCATADIPMLNLVSGKSKTNRLASTDTTHLHTHTSRRVMYAVKPVDWSELGDAPT